MDSNLQEMTDYDGGIHLVKAVFPFNGRDEDEVWCQLALILILKKLWFHDCDVSISYVFNMLLFIHSFALRKEKY